MLRKTGLEFNFEEQAESLDILEIRDWEQKLIHSKHNTEDQKEEEDWGYGGNGFDDDGF
jgi:hypothetical protein